jgi:hypothetical protein
VVGAEHAGGGSSTGSFTGLLSSAGTLLTGSADIAAQLTGTVGGIQCPLTAPQPVTVGNFYWALMLVNLATTQPFLWRGVAPQQANTNLAPAAYRFATNGAGLTALQSVTPGSNAQGAALSFWVGWS